MRNKHEDAIVFAYRAISTQAGVTQAPIGTAIALAYYVYPDERDRLHEWGRVMVSGESNGKADRAAIRFRNQLLNGQYKKSII